MLKHNQEKLTQLAKHLSGSFQLNSTFCFASKMNFVNTTSLLLEMGANVNVKDYDGYTMVMHASKNNHLEMTMLLVDGGADVDVRYKENDFSSLFFAIHNNHLEVLRVLAPYSKERCDDDGNCFNTPLSFAFQQKNLDAVKILVECGFKN